MALLLERLFFGAIGLSIFAGALAWAWRNGAYRWRRLAAVYGGERGRRGRALAQRRMQNLILRGGGLAYNAHNGITTFTVHETGLAFDLMFPFSIGHPPFFIPFADLTATAQDWYLNTESFELSARREPDIKLILTADAMKWIEHVAGDRWSAGYSLLHKAKNLYGPDTGNNPS